MTCVAEVFAADPQSSQTGSEAVDLAPILSRANDAIATLECYKARQDEANRDLSIAEFAKSVRVRDVMTVIHWSEMIRRTSLEIDEYIFELGTEGSRVERQLDELVSGNDLARELIVWDYHAGTDAPTAAKVVSTLAELGQLSDAELLQPTTLAMVFGYSSTAEAQDLAIRPHDCRVMATTSPLHLTPACRCGRSARGNCCG